VAVDSPVCELEERGAALVDVDADADGGVGRVSSLAIYFVGLALDGGDRIRAGLSVLLCRES
jgi:hypothetical protein